MTMNTLATAHPPLARSSSHLLSVLTVRLFVGLVLIWLVRAVVMRLPFSASFSLPDLPLTTQQVVTAVVYLAALALLLGYARALAALWPQAFPQHAPLAGALAALVYVAALGAGYLGLEALIGVLIGQTGLLLLQAIALVIAVVLLVQAARAVYHHVPRWFATLRFDGLAAGPREMACLNCGQLNPAGMNYCGRCGRPLGADPALSAAGPD
jgi:hypothetical protein